MDLCSEVENNLLNSLIEKHRLSNYKIISEEGTKKGDNYVGLIKKVSIEGLDENDKPKTLNFILKQAPPDEVRREMFRCEKLFNTEISMYEKVLATFKILEEEHEIKNRLKMPNLSLFSKQIGAETLILEDLTYEGYEIKNRRKPMDLEHCRIVTKYFAKLHSFSFILKKKNSELYEEFSKLDEGLFTGEYMETFRDDRINHNIDRNVVSLDKEKDAELLSKILKLYDNFIEEYQFCTSTESSNGYNVITHGDGWINNIFFKYKDENNKKTPTEVCFIDWQLSRHCSPTLDLFYFIYTATEKEFRDKYLKSLYEEYYTHLSKNLSSFGETIEDHFPKEEFYRHIKVFSKFGLMVALLILQFLLCDSKDCVDPSDIAKDIDGVQEKMIKVAMNDDIFKKRIKGIIEEMVENKYI